METQELLTKFVSINSVFPGNHLDPARPGEGELGEFIEQLLKDQGFQVQRQYLEGQQDRFNMLGEKGQGASALLLSGHMDTIPASVGWGTDPYAPNGWRQALWAGGLRHESGLCAILQAVQDFSPESYRLKVAFLVDEEHISEGAYTLIRSSWMQDVSAVLVPELGASQRPRFGPGMLTLGRRGRVDIDIRVRGRAAHAAHPEEGVSALLRGAVLALGLERLPLAEHPQLGRASATIRSFTSQAQALSIPDEANLRIDRHLVPPETPVSARQDVEDVIEQLYQEGSLERSLRCQSQ